MHEASTASTISERLPAELIYEILEYCIAITPEKLFTTPGRFWGYNTSAPSLQRNCHLLHVSKGWHNIGTHFLYASLWITKASHAESIAGVLRTNPLLRRVVRDIRMSPVEDGFGDNMQFIVENAPNLRNVRLELDTSDWAAISSMDSLAKALPCLNPTMLWLSRNISISGKHEYRIASIISTCLAKDYLSLVSPDSPSITTMIRAILTIVQKHLRLCMNFNLTEETAHAIRQCRQLETITIFLNDAQYGWPAPLLNLFDIPNLRTICCSTTSPSTLKVVELRRRLTERGIKQGIVDKVIIVPH